jgi:hypothetical protein
MILDCSNKRLEIGTLSKGGGGDDVVKIIKKTLFLVGL